MSWRRTRRSWPTATSPTSTTEPEERCASLRRRFSSTASRTKRVRGPDHGADTDEVLSEVGYEMDEIIQLKIDGAIW